jgi:hypothetical protein
MLQWLINVFRSLVAALFLPMKAIGEQSVLERFAVAAPRRLARVTVVGVVGCSLQRGSCFLPIGCKALPGSHTGKNL